MKYKELTGSVDFFVENKKSSHQVNKKNQGSDK